MIDVLCQFGVVVERASIDEAYLDLTSVIDEIDPSPSSCSDSEQLALALPNTHVIGWGSDSPEGNKSTKQ